MQVEIVTPAGEKYSGEAVAIRAATASGEVGILPGHRDMMTALGTGGCHVQTEAHGEPTTFLVDQGYLQVSQRGAKVIIVTERAQTPDEIDVEAARADLAAAKGELDGSKEAVGSEAWKVKRHAVALAEARLSVAGAS
ncbi:MAG: ATP synthase F1 subunit epsilon [Myxococcales bacterium]|nr:ATP synthase F1 subunit epsilon [Myxococcales bacterium]